MAMGAQGGMKIGLFGKLPSKRDFISYGLDRQVSDVIEPWLQSAMAASRDQLGADWLESYNNAPIWRFWLGHEICGSTVSGAVMPSVDGVGRYFPLVLVASGVQLAPPATEPDHLWYQMAERLLLAALDQGRPFDQVLSLLDRMPAPVATGSPETIEGAFAATMREGMPSPDGALSYWWIGPHDGVPVKTLLRRGMPGPYDYMEMIRPIPMPEPEPQELSLTTAPVPAEEEELPLSAGLPSEQGPSEAGPSELPSGSPSGTPAGPNPFVWSDMTVPGAAATLSVQDAPAEPGDEAASADGAPAPEGPDAMNGEAETEADETAPAEAETPADAATPDEAASAASEAEEKTGGDELVLGRTMVNKADV